MRNLYKFTLIMLTLSPKSGFGTDFEVFQQPVIIKTNSSLWSDNSDVDDASSVGYNSSTDVDDASSVEYNSSTEGEPSYIEISDTQQSSLVGTPTAAYTFSLNGKKAIVPIYDNETYAGLARVLGRTFGTNKKQVGLIHKGEYVDLQSKELVDINILDDLSDYNSNAILLVHRKNNY